MSTQNTLTLETAPIVVFYGDDDFTVKEKGQDLFEKWKAQWGENDAEIINGEAENASKAEETISRVEGALMSLPFFGSCKLVWLKNCNFMGEDRTASSQAVSQRLTAFAEILKKFRWEGVRFLITAEKISGKRVISKILHQIAYTEEHKSITITDRGWEMKMEQYVLDVLPKYGKQMDRRALSLFVLYVGPNLRLLRSELEKLSLYTGSAPRITEEDIELLVTRNKQSKSFALADAIGSRNLPLAIRLLDNDLAEIRSGSRSMSIIGILYGIISKIRMMLLLREMLDLGWVTEGRSPKFSLPDGILPNDSKLNPALAHPFMVSKCIPQARQYTQQELINAMTLLLECNYKLVYTNTSSEIAIQHTVIDSIRGRSPHESTL